MPRKPTVLLIGFLLLLAAGLVATNRQGEPAGGFALDSVWSAETGAKPDGDAPSDQSAPEAPAPDLPEVVPDGAGSGDAETVESVDAVAAMMVETGSGFTYQGRVTYQGAPVDNTCDFQFSLWDAVSGGAQVGATQAVNAITVDEGVFTTILNDGDEFGTRPFGGDERFLQMALRCPAGSGTFTTLSPRQELTVGPYAQYAEEAGDAQTLEGQSATAFQRRRGHTCPPGSRTRTLNAGGTVYCVRDPLAAMNIQPSVNLITTLDPANLAGYDTSVTIGADGLGLISYLDVTADALKVAHCDNVACTSATITTLDDPANLVGYYTSVTIGADGLGLISYRDSTAGALKVAHCDNVACTSATITTLDDPANIVGYYTSVTIGADGLGLISYLDVTADALKVAHCDNVACTSATITTLDDPANLVGYDTSVTIGADGLGLISYRDLTAGALKVAHCDNVACTSATITTLDDPANLVGEYTSVTIGTDGLGLISYRDSTAHALKVAHCDNVACTSATITTLDDPANLVGDDTSVTIGADGLGLISYSDPTAGALKVAHCGNIACTSATITTLDDPANLVGYDTSVTIGADGLGLISYRDLTAGALKVAHCGNIACTGNNVHSVDATNAVGSFTSVAIGTDGLGLISYRDVTNTSLKVAHCNDVGCSGAPTVTTLDNTADVGEHTSIAIGADGLGIVSYYDTTTDDLKVAHCADVACTAASPAPTALDTSSNVGQYTSITIGTDGLPIISYYRVTSGDLKVAHCEDLACSGPPTSTTLDSTGNVGGFTSIAIGADGLPVISYYDWTNQDLKVAHCANVACTATSTTPTTLDGPGDVGGANAIAIGVDGLPVIAYTDYSNTNLKVAHCNNAACTSHTATTIDSTGIGGYWPSITIGTDGLPVISYHMDTGQDLKVAHCSNPTCTAASLTTVDSANDVGEYTSIAIGSDGLPIVSFFAVTGSDLRVAHCETLTCEPFYAARRR